MNIQGIGIISSAGRGIESFAKALRQGHAEPKFSEYSQITKKSIPVFSVDDTLLRDKDVLKNSRRADRFCKMAVLAACDALADSGVGVEENEKIGVIVATAFGPHKTTFKFLDNILDYGESGVSPTIFSHSVHNAAASYITSALNIRGPVCTLTDFCFPFHEACKIADSWLNQGRCKYVLTGTVDELSSAMEYICDQKLNVREDGIINPFAFSDHAQTVPGEGSVFFLLCKNEEDSRYCTVACKDELASADVFILESDGMIPDESIYKGVDTGDAELFNSSPIFGGIMSSSSFHCASGALMLKEGKVFSRHVYKVLRKEKKNLSHVVCLKYGCEKDKSMIHLTKQSY